MDKRFEMMPTIEMHEWESVVMEEAGYGKYVDSRNCFDWNSFHEEKGIEYFTEERYIEEVFADWTDGYDYMRISKEDYLPRGYNEEAAYGKKVADIRAEIKAAAIRLFDKGIAPEEFVLFGH